MNRGWNLQQEKVIVFLILCLFLFGTVFSGIVSGTLVPNLKFDEKFEANEELLPAIESERLRDSIEPVSKVVEPKINNNVLYGNDWCEIVNPDGTRTQTIGFPTFYRDGAYHPVDSTIKRLDVDDYAFGVEEGKYQAYFKEDASEPMPVRVNYNNYELSMGLNEMGYFDSNLDNYLTYPIKPSIGQSQQNKIMYSNVLPDTDLEYVYGNTELKENIILNDISGFNLQDSETLDFHFDLGYPQELEIWVNGENIQGETIINSDFELRTPQNKVIFKIPSPVIYEQDNPIDQVIGYFQVNTKDRVTDLILRVPNAWILNPEREFPLVVDPGVSIFTTLYPTQSVGLWTSGKSETNIWMGVENTNVEMYGLYRFNLSSIPPYSTVIKGTIDLFCKSIYSASGYGKAILPFRIIEEWKPANMANSDDMPTIAENYTEDQQDMDTSGMWYLWNITPLVQGWVSRYYANYGLAFTTGSPYGNAWQYSTAENGTSTNPPKLNITYMNNSVQIDPIIEPIITPEDTPIDFSLAAHEHRKFEKYNTLTPYSYQYPFRGEVEDSRRQQMIYYPNDIGMSGIIDKISFWKTTTTSTGIYENLSVRMAHANPTIDAITTNFDSNYFGELIEVYNRSIFTINQPINSWIELDLDNVFNYQTHYNLIVDIRWLGDNDVAIPIEGTWTSTVQEMVYAGDWNASTGNLNWIKPDIKFEVISSDEVTLDDSIGGLWLPFFNESVPGIRYQLLYRQDQIGKAGYIDKISFLKFNDNSGRYDNLSIRLVNTNKTELVDTFDLNYGKGTPTIVMPNSSKYLGEKGGEWIEFDVDDTFYYNNHDHLIIEIRWKGTNTTVPFGVILAFRACGYSSVLFAGDDYATTGSTGVAANLIKIKFKDTDLTWDITNVDPTLMTITPSDVNPGDDKFTITPVPDAFGLDPVRVTLTDNLQGWTAEQWVDVEVLPVNDPPTAPINVTPGDKTPKRWYAGPIPIHWEHQDIDSPQQNVSIEYKLGASGTWNKLFNSTDFPFPYINSDFLWLNPDPHENIYIRISTWDGEYWSPWNATPYPFAFDDVTPIIESVEIIDLAKNNHEYVRNGHLVLISVKLAAKFFADLAPGPYIFANLTGFSLGNNVPLTLELTKEYANITTSAPITTIPVNGVVPVPVFIPTLFGEPIVFEASTIADNLGVEFSEPSIPPGMWLNYTNDIAFAVNVSDNGSGVDLSTIQYQISTDGGQNWNGYKDWQSARSSSRADSVIPEILVNLTEGVKNRLRVRAKDNIDNNYVESPAYTIRIDTRGATYSEIIPATQKWYNKTSIKCSINISDNTSGVNPASIKYRYSTTGLPGLPPTWTYVPDDGKFIFGKSVRCEIELNFSEGEYNRLQWYAEDFAGNEIETDTLQYLVDLTPPLFRNPDPTQNGWANSYQYKCKIIFEDGYSGIDNLTIQYRTSKSGIANYSAWKDAQFTELSAMEVQGIATGDFADGDQNFIQWRANDRAGNSVMTVDYQMNIDLTELEFIEPKPVFGTDPKTWSQTQNVLCSVTLNDGATGSGVDATSIEYRYSTSGTNDSAFSNWNNRGLTSAKNAKSVTESVTITFDYGDQNYIQWRAKDVAGNGWTLSSKYQIKVTPLDSDGDGMPDWWEELFDLDPNDASDANDDDDNDGLTNLEEYELIADYGNYTRPDKADTDGDDVLDGQEIKDGTNPLDETDFSEKKGEPDDKGQDYLWLILLIIIIIIVILLVIFLLMRRKKEEEPEEEVERVEEEELEEEAEEFEGEGEELEEWKLEDEVEAPVAEPDEIAAEEEEEFIDIDLKESSKPLKGKMPGEKKGKKPDVVRHGKPKKGKLPGKGKMPKKGKAPAPELEAEPEIEPEEEFAEEEMAGELAAAEAEPREPILVKLDESATCNICLGAIKTGLPVVKCTCGKKYHDSCAARVGECPNCDTNLSNPIDKLNEEEDEITDDDLDAIDDE